MEEKNYRQDGTEADLREYIHILWKGKWIILLCLIFAISAGVALTVTLEPVYKSETRILIVEKNISSELFGEFSQEYSTVQEVNFQTQVEILGSRQFREEIIKNLNLNTGPEELEKKINISRVSGTKVISISVQDNDPVLSREIANMLAQVYISWSRETYRENLKTILDEVNLKMEDSRKELDDTSAKIAVLEDSERKVPESLKKELEVNSELYLMLSEKYENLRICETLEDSTAEIIEPATVPQYPVKPNKKLIIISSFFIGLFAGCAVIFLKEFLDNTIKTVSDVKKYYGLNTISQIVYDKTYNVQKRELTVIKDTNSPISESIKELRTNIGYFNIDKKIKIIGITSAQSEEGKTFLSANLAAALAQSGTKTLLVNADFRKPVIHKYFRHNNISGITSILTGYSKPADEIEQTKIENLYFLASSPVPPNPAELLESEAMGQLIDKLSEKFDYIIIDTPPIVPVTDLVVLAKKIDSIIIVARAGKVTRNIAAQAREKLKVIENKIMGVVLNGIIRRAKYYYYYK